VLSMIMFHTFKTAEERSHSLIHKPYIHYVMQKNGQMKFQIICSETRSYWDNYRFQIGSIHNWLMS
jgi:hypothetical protein